MKLQKLVPFAFAGLAMLGIVSCQNDDEYEVQGQEKYQTEYSALEEILANLVESHDNGTEGDSYIIFEASTGKYTTMSADDYALASAFANVIVHEDNPIAKAPSGNGWIRGGSGKGKLDAIKAANDLANKLEPKRNFEIHVEYDSKGRFTVWYRYV